MVCKKYHKKIITFDNGAWQSWLTKFYSSIKNKQIIILNYKYDTPLNRKFYVLSDDIYIYVFNEKKKKNSILFNTPKNVQRDLTVPLKSFTKTTAASWSKVKHDRISRGLCQQGKSLTGQEATELAGFKNMYVAT